MIYILLIYFSCLITRDLMKAYICPILLKIQRDLSVDESHHKCLFAPPLIKIGTTCLWTKAIINISVCSTSYQDWNNLSVDKSHHKHLCLLHLLSRSGTTCPWMKALINGCVCTTSLRIRNNLSVDENPHKCLSQDQEQRVHRWKPPSTPMFAPPLARSGIWTKAIINVSVCSTSYQDLEQPVCGQKPS